MSGQGLVWSELEVNGGEYIFGYVMGGIPTGIHNAFERELLDGIPTAVSAVPDRNIYAAIRRKIRSVFMGASNTPASAA